MHPIEEALAYTFQRPETLTRALTHSSFANEKQGNGKSNERLEFLGDSVLSIVVSDYLFRLFTHLPEGELTKLRAALVCEKTLHRFALEIDLGAHLLLGKGEIQTGGRSRPSILADAFEAVIAAIYLDGGMEEARKFIMRFVEEELETHAADATDYKTALQEVVQHNPGNRVTYVLTGESGPAHAKRFVVEVRLGEHVLGSGTGKSKKVAEQAAARAALQEMKTDDEK